MSFHSDTFQPDQPWKLSAQPRTRESTPASDSLSAAPARPVSGGWDCVTVLVVLGVLLCGIAVVAGVRFLDLALGAAAKRVEVCNRFDVSVGARCTGSDPFIVVHDGSTNAVVQVTVPGDAPRAPMPVTISVTETNGAGLVLATGRGRFQIRPGGAETATLSVQAVFTTCHIPLPIAGGGSQDWERRTYAIQIRAGSTALGDTLFHLAV